MSFHLSDANLAAIRGGPSKLIYFEPGGLRVTSDDLLDEIERLRGELATLAVRHVGNDALEQAASWHDAEAARLETDAGILPGYRELEPSRAGMRAAAREHRRSATAIRDMKEQEQ